MEKQISGSEAECHPIERESPGDSDEFNLEEVISRGSLDFDEWTSLISRVERKYRDNVEKIGLVYDSFLSAYPLCHGYWRKYADHKMRLCTVDKVVEVFEQAVQSATYCVGVWVDYCRLGMSVFEESSDVRRLFKRAISVVGKDYLCHTLLDKYIEFELSQQQWTSLAHIYIHSMKFPTKKLHHYYQRFKALVSILKKGMESLSDCSMEEQSDPVDGSEVSVYEEDNISQVIKDLLDPSLRLARSKALQKYVSVGERIYQQACQLDENINCFESRIRRPYYHVKPLDSSQLENWHHYLDFIEMQKDFDWAVKLYERCLISCADYPEFWMRYVDFMETKGGREIANFALERATKVFLKRVPEIHLYSARYKEQIKDVHGARAAFIHCDAELHFDFVESVITKANMEKRLGNFVAACKIYEEALRTAPASGKTHTLPKLYIHFSWLKYMMTKSADEARDILIDGIKKVPRSKSLLEELFRFAMMHSAPRHIDVINSIVHEILSPRSGMYEGLSDEDKQDISVLYLEFIDFCGTIHEVRRAWNRHVKLFPHTMRSTSHTKSASCGKATGLRGLQETVIGVPHKQSGDTGSHSPIQLSYHDRKLPLEGNQCILSDQATAVLNSNQKSPSPGKQDIQHGQKIIDQLQSFGSGDGSEERLPDAYSEVSGQLNESTAEQKGQPQDSTRELESKTDSVEASQECMKRNDAHQEPEYDIVAEQNMNPPSLEKLSLDPIASETPNLVPSPYQACEATQVTGVSKASIVDCGLTAKEDCRTSRDPSVDSQVGTRTSESGQSHVKMAYPSSDCHFNSGLSQPLSHPYKPGNSRGVYHQRNFAGKVHRDSKFRFRSHLHRKSKQRHHPSRNYSRVESVTQMPINQGYSCLPQSLQNQQCQQGSQEQNQCQLAVPGSTMTASMQNTQQQNDSACQSQLPAQLASCPSAQIPQNPMPGNEQYMQNNQAYNQMWQYYYYQQQHQYMQYHYQQQQYAHEQQMLQLNHQQLQSPSDQQEQFLQQQQQYNQLMHLQYQQQTAYLLQQQQQEQKQQSQGEEQQEQMEKQQHEQQIYKSPIQGSEGSASQQHSSQCSSGGQVKAESE